MRTPRPVGPGLARPVAIDLEAEPVGIRQIKRLAHEVIRGALEPRPGLDEARQGSGGRRAVPHPDRHVVEPARARRPWPVRPAMEYEQEASARGEPGLALVAPEKLEPQAFHIERRR